MTRSRRRSRRFTGASRTGKESLDGSLLAAVLDAHGSLESWQQVTKLTAKLSAGGFFWAARGWPGAGGSHMLTLDPQREHVTLSSFPQDGSDSVLDVDPERVVIRSPDGRLIEERNEPRGSFPKPFDITATPWDSVQVAYFTTAAQWTYLTAPYLFTYPGVEASEIDPWNENGEVWQRLAVTFPPTIATHNRDQVFYYDQALMQRRMDYAPDVAGNAPIAHYTHDPKTFDGLLFPTRRLVHTRDQAGTADQRFAAITVDVEHIKLDRG